jgi:Na+-driven multidrug efflux pump
MIPVSFGVGAALTTMVGHSVGKGDWARARELAWAGGRIVCGLCAVIGVVVALKPRLWTGLFSADPAVLAMGDRCLPVIAPAYAFLGLGMTMYFASQGAGRMRLPFAAAVARLAIAAGVGSLALGVFGWGLEGMFACVAAGLVVFGALIASGVRERVWS